MAKTDAMTELKACPFCGGKAKLLIQSETDGTWCVECSECGAAGPTAGVWSEQEAIDDWNQRNPIGEKPMSKPTSRGTAGPPSQPPTIDIQSKLEQKRKQQVMRKTAQIVRDAIQSERYTLGVYYIDAEEKLQKHFFQTPFPYGDFPVIEQHFRSQLSRILKARTAPKPPAEESSPTSVLDELAEGKGFQPVKLPDVVDVPPEDLDSPPTQTPITETEEPV